MRYINIEIIEAVGFNIRQWKEIKEEAGDDDDDESVEEEGKQKQKKNKTPNTKTSSKQKPHLNDVDELRQLERCDNCNRYKWHKITRDSNVFSMIWHI